MHVKSSFSLIGFYACRQAYMEIESMLALMDMVQRKEFLSLHMIQKPAPTLDVLTNALSFRVLAKQQVCHSSFKILVLIPPSANAKGLVRVSKGCSAYYSIK